MYEDEFIKRLSELRIKKGVSARDMSLALGQNSGYINHIENSQTLPSMTVFFNICDYFNITPGEFFQVDTPDIIIISQIIQELKCMDENQLTHLLSLLKDLKKPNSK